MDWPNKPTPGPWTTEGFEQITGHGQFYGGLIMGADGETIVAQCVAPHNAQLIADAPQLYERGRASGREEARQEFEQAYNLLSKHDTALMLSLLEAQEQLRNISLRRLAWSRIKGLFQRNRYE